MFPCLAVLGGPVVVSRAWAQGLWEKHCLSDTEGHSDRPICFPLCKEFCSLYFT